MTSRAFRNAAFLAVGLAVPISPVLALTVRAWDEHSCTISTIEEAEEVLGVDVTSVVSGSGFCTWLTGGPVLVTAVIEYPSAGAARAEMEDSRRRREAELKSVSFLKRPGAAMMRAVGAESIELSVRDGERIVEVAVAGDAIDTSLYEKRIEALVRTLVLRGRAAAAADRRR